MRLPTSSKISRRLGEQFFFKPERDLSPKSAMVRRPYPPGEHSKARRRASSDFKADLVAKQKVRFLYGLTDRMLKTYVRQAGRKRGKGAGQVLGEILERRLDTVVFRLGMAASRRAARHLITYGHIAVNDRPVKRPAILLRPGDRVAVRDSSRSLLPFEGLEFRLKKHQPPPWLALDPVKLSGSLVRLPAEGDQFAGQHLGKVIGYYSR